jgi:hypothetical protein
LSSAEQQDKLRAQLELEKAQLKADLRRLEEEHALKMKTMEQAHQAELLKTVQTKDAEKKVEVSCHLKVVCTLYQHNYVVQ